MQTSSRQSFGTPQFWQFSVFPDACTSLCLVLCHVLLLTRLQTTKVERNLRRWVAVGGSVSVLIMVGIGILRCLQISFCASLHFVLALLTQAGEN
jgi:hypothetical protein